MADKKVVGEALQGREASAKHKHPVVLTGRFAKEESREPEHKRSSKSRKPKTR